MISSWNPLARYVRKAVHSIPQDFTRRGKQHQNEDSSCCVSRYTVSTRDVIRNAPFYRRAGDALSSSKMVGRRDLEMCGVLASPCWLCSWVMTARRFGVGTIKWRHLTRRTWRFSLFASMTKSLLRAQPMATRSHVNGGGLAWSKMPQLGYTIAAGKVACGVSYRRCARVPAAR